MLEDDVGRSLLPKQKSALPLEPVDRRAGQ
jgi:hypothetical protein